MRDFLANGKLRSNRQAGFAMMEILMTIFVIAIGALGLAGSQLTALKFNKESAIRTYAAFQVLEISERMRSNMAGVRALAYDRNLGYTAALAATAADPGCGGNTDCSASALAQLDLHDWLNNLNTMLPNGTGAIVPVAGAAYVYDVVVMWKEKSLNDTGGVDPSCPNGPEVGVRCLHVTAMP